MALTSAEAQSRRADFESHVPHRVALVTNGLGCGGAEAQLLRLARMLVARGDEVGILSILPVVECSEAGGLALPVATLDLGPLARGARAISSGARILRKWAPDTLISFVYQANVLGRISGRLAGVPTIVSSIRNEHFGARGRELVLRGTDHLATVTTTNSARAARSLIDRGVVPADRIVVVPNGVDTNLYRTDAARRAEVRAALGLGDDEFLWLSIGRLHDQKDHASLVHALAHLAPSRPSLAIVGDGPLRGPLEALAAQLRIDPPIRFLGLRADVPDLLAAADGLVLSSVWEGSPNVVLEVMAAAVPVIATDVGGVSELVRSGETGFVVSPRDARALSIAMGFVMALPIEARRNMGAWGRDFVERKHSLDAMRRGWFATLERCAAECRRHPRAQVRLPMTTTARE
jgi:glycosyltransferase involved in cell wall biosynthesis